jgi:hypothetical protein
MASDADNDRLEQALQLAEFANSLARASLEQIVPVVALTLDDCVELLRRTCPPQTLIEMVAAVAAELHKRHPPKNGPRAMYAPHVGNA